jgi:hypothetical protein
MRQILIAIGLCYTLSSCQSEASLFKVDNSKIGVNYKRTRGTIFDNTYPFYLFFLGDDIDSTKRWTPNKEDIELAEQILKTKIRKINHNYPKDYGPRVNRRLNSYFRQYVGYTNEKGQRIIHANCSWDRRSLINKILGDDERLKFNSDYSVVMDGGSYHWQIEINLDERTIYGFRVHGVG